MRIYYIDILFIAISIVYKSWFIMKIAKFNPNVTLVWHLVCLGIQ